MVDYEPIGGGADIMSEILTVSSRNTFRIENLSHPHFSSPSNCIGRVYRTDKSFGTGFIVGHRLLLTCQHGFSLYQSHKCGVFYKLTLLAVASSDSDPIASERDPITNQDYSVSFDAAIFQINEECVCGLYCTLPILRPVVLARNSPADSEVKLMGFIGEISEKSTPLLPITCKELRDLSSTFISGILTESYGKILKTGELSAISCPSTAGFSGSPVLWKSEISGHPTAFAIFIGGPALSTHKRLLEIGKISHKDFESAKTLIISLMLCVSLRKCMVKLSWMPDKEIL